MRWTLAILTLSIVCGGCGSIAAGTYPGPGWQKIASPRAENASSEPVQEVDSALFCRPRTLNAAEPPSEHASAARKPDPAEPKRDPAKHKHDPASIQKTIRAAYPDFVGCYEGALRRKRDAAGRVRVRFAIDVSGDVAKACIEPPVLQDGVAVQCILRRFEKLQFGSGEPVLVVYPVEFKPHAAASADK